MQISLIDGQDRFWDDYDIDEPEIDEWEDNGYSASDFI
jgi:hypothetical protein